MLSLKIEQSPKPKPTAIELEAEFLQLPPQPAAWQSLPLLALLEQQPLADQAAVEAKLLALARSEDWLTAAKSLICLGRVGSAASSDALLQLLPRLKRIEFQLLAWDSWWQLPLPQDERLPVIRDFLRRDQVPPPLLRAVVWSLAFCPAFSSAVVFVDFVAAGKAVKLIADELLTELWFRLAAVLTVTDIETLKAAQPRFASWLLYRHRGKPTDFGLFPGRDYLWQHAKALGIEQAEYKKLFYKVRKKDKNRRPNL